MINDNELMISNKSYVNKDFATIYPELLDYIKILTNKWNPQTSNESDPGIVLTKLLAFMGDKENYNIDKNALENFVLSCTQESSMRKNLAPLGYEMKYYHGATTDIQFTYTGDDLPTTYDESKWFIIPALKTVITSDDDSVQFVLIDNVSIHTKNETVTGTAIQGRLDTLMTGDSDIIQLENIDSNNRLYFPVSMVAENGVFIHCVDDNEIWSKVDNLNVLSPGLKVFLFGYDSARGLPYIEFPEDIANLIKSGLHIDYIITNGLDGNVSAKTLTKIISPSSVQVIGAQDKYVTFTDEEDNVNPVVVRNLNASIDGANPESINEAYNNFKKTIGTFDTLVTCRDYANYIYNMYNTDSNSNVVSNVQVSDRRDDFTCSTGVISFDEYGQTQVNVSNADNANVEAFDLFLYPLNPITSYTMEEYNKSFTPLLSNNYIVRGLEESKCISHDYYDHGNNTYLYAFKNKLRLNAKIATTHKVNNYERKDILANVVSALIKHFNARKVDYGYEIPYNDILKTIEEADSRISYVNLLDPDITTNVMFNKANADGNLEVPLISSDGLDYLISLLAHNILMGRVSLFDYDEDFNYDFGQEKIENSRYPMKLTNLKTISSKADITLTSGVEDKVLDNEVIQLVAPSMITDQSYTAHINYCFTYEEGTPTFTGIIVEKNTNYKLKANEVLWIHYTDASTKNIIIKKYKEGDIIQPTFDLKYTPTLGGTIEKTFIYNGVEKTLPFTYTSANESINIRKINKTKFDSNTYFYWIRNNKNEDGKIALFTNSEAIHSDPTNPNSSIIGYEAILGDGEYLFYTDSGFNSLVSLGSGTTIKYNGTFDSIPTVEEVKYEDIAEEGLLALRSKWCYLKLTEHDYPLGGTSLIVQENTILTLTQGDIITWTKASGDTSTTIKLDNFLKPISGKIDYVFGDGSEVEPLEQYDIGEEGYWRIKSRLDINASKTKSQSIKKTSNHNQIIQFYDKDYVANSEGANDHMIVLSNDGETFNLNESYQFMGAENIDVTSKDLTTEEIIYPFSVYCYEYEIVGDKAHILTRDSNGYAHEEVTSSKSFEYSVPMVGECGILMIYIEAAKGTTELTVTSQGPSATNKLNCIRIYNKNYNDYWKRWQDDSNASTSITGLKTGIYCIELNKGVNKLTITSNDADVSIITLDYIKYYSALYATPTETKTYYGLNPSLGLKNINISGKTITDLEKDLLSKIKYLDNHSGGSEDPKFYYTNRIRNTKVIESNNLLDPLALYDVNNIANKFTISQIEFSEDITEDIDIMRSSRL